MRNKQIKNGHGRSVKGNSRPIPKIKITKSMTKFITKVNGLK